MSSSIETNVGSREGSASSTDRDVSQIFDSASGQSGTGSYTLPLAGNLNKTISVDTKKRLLRKLIYPKLCAKMEAAGFKYELSIEEQSLTMLHENAETITSRLTTVVRQVHKGKEYLVWYEVLEGFDKNGVAVIGSGAYVQRGLDKDVAITPIRDIEGNITSLKLANVTTDIFTEEFSPDKLQDILNNAELDEHIQFSFTNNFGKSYGGFSAEEMIHCSAAELSSRGQLGKSGEDLSVLYSELTAKDKLFLQSQAPK